MDCSFSSPYILSFFDVFLYNEAKGTTLGGHHIVKEYTKRNRVHFYSGDDIWDGLGTGQGMAKMLNGAMTIYR